MGFQNSKQAKHGDDHSNEGVAKPTVSANQANVDKEEPSISTARKITIRAAASHGGISNLSKETTDDAEDEVDGDETQVNTHNDRKNNKSFIGIGNYGDKYERNEEHSEEQVTWTSFKQEEVNLKGISRFQTERPDDGPRNKTDVLHPQAKKSTDNSLSGIDLYKKMGKPELLIVIQELREERNTLAAINKDMQEQLKDLQRAKDSSGRKEGTPKRDDRHKSEKDLLQELEEAKWRLAEKDSLIDELRTRLSRAAADRLTDNNPNITDLSDPNRPGKIADRYSELYNNEWSDAYEELTSKGHKSATDAIQILLILLKDVYLKCYDVAQTNLNDIQSQLMLLSGHTEKSAYVTSTIKAFKDERKKMFKSFLPTLNMETKHLIDAVVKIEKGEHVHLKKYVEVATDLCWLMCIQDPPLHLHSDCKQGAKLDDSSFTMYTVLGTRVDYPVWPALLLHKGGPLLRKGVMQAIPEKQTTGKRNAVGIAQSTTNEQSKNDW